MDFGRPVPNRQLTEDSSPGQSQAMSVFASPTLLEIDQGNCPPSIGDSEQGGRNPFTGFGYYIDSSSFLVSSTSLGVLPGDVAQNFLSSEACKKLSRRRSK